MKLTDMRTRSGDDCLSDLQLDSLAVGTLDGGQAAQAERHLSSCDRCSTRRQGLAAATLASAALLPSSPSQGRPASGIGPSARTRARQAWLGRVVAAAAVAA